MTQTNSQTRQPERATLRVAGRDDLDLPVHGATDGASGVEISRLLDASGVVTYDPGYANTASCTSAITYIDGDAGILRYRGYPIDQLAQRSTFVEVAYL